MFYQTDNDDQEALCDSYTFPDNEDGLMNSTGKITSIEYGGMFDLTAKWNLNCTEAQVMYVFGVI